MNILPWGGPTLRVMTVFETEIPEAFVPMIIPMIVGWIFVMMIAVFFGKKEAARLQREGIGYDTADHAKESEKESVKISRAQRTANVILLVAALFVMMKGIVSPGPTMILGTVLAFLINCREEKAQNAMIKKFSGTIARLVLIVLCAGTFTGVLNNSGMLEAIATTMAQIIPTSLGRFAPLVIAVLGVPMSQLFTADGFYYGVLPALGTAFEGAGIPGIVMGRAALLGQMTLGFPFSPLVSTTYMLAEMTDLELGDLQKKGIPMAWLVSIVMTVVAVITGCITI